VVFQMPESRCGGASRYHETTNSPGSSGEPLRRLRRGPPLPAAKEVDLHRSIRVVPREQTLVPYGREFFFFRQQTKAIKVVYYRQFGSSA